MCCVQPRSPVVGPETIGASPTMATMVNGFRLSAMLRSDFENEFYNHGRAAIHRVLATRLSCKEKEHMQTSTRYKERPCRM
jgi:hypothetical protein